MVNCRNLDLVFISAKGLKDANIIQRMDVYAVVSISGLDDGPHRTPVHKAGGTNPTWNFPIKFTVNELAALSNRCTPIVKIKAVGMFMNIGLGQVHVPVKDLLKTQENAIHFVSFPVIRKRSGKPKGELNFSYKFGERLPLANEPVQQSPKRKLGLGVSDSYPLTCDSSLCGGGCG